MLDYNQNPIHTISCQDKVIYCFNIDASANIDKQTVDSFGEEWEKFSSFSKDEIEKIGNEYFDIIDHTILNKDIVVLDLGCGSGRWSKYLANKVKYVEAVDPSKAVISASMLLNEDENVRVTQASVDNIPFNNNSFDFAMSLGVLHHIPDTKKALLNLVEKTKVGGYVLLYLYYNLDNRGVFYKFLFKMSVYPRLFISKMPKSIKKISCDIIAVGVYLPLIIFAKIVKNVLPTKSFYQQLPLSYYIGKSFNVVRNDALDRFGTPLEQRFSKIEIENMMQSCGLSELKFSENAPYWHVVGKRIH
jgi:ubiquinone/menaquinone biosynthesis C-methylase UbiE